jgi:septum site-determining protein MinC
MPPILLGERRVTLLRGRRDGLEVTLSPHDLEEGFTELQARLTEQPSFYRGAAALVNFGAALPSPDDLRRLRELLDAAGISLRGVAGFNAELEGVARQEGLVLESPREELEWRRELRPVAEVNLSESARSLVPDFAGARKDIAQRRRRGEASVPRLHPELLPAVPTPALHVVETVPGTLYQAATLRGGQVLHHSGNIVVVGDVNPGAELIATGDVLVFGRLAGIAHAGAQGDANARIYALDLAPTQLRIATFIAAEDAQHRSAPVPEVVLVRDGRIVVLPLDRLHGHETFEVSTT